MAKRANMSLADKRSEIANLWFECADIEGEVVGHDGWEHDGLRTLTRTIYFANGAKPSIAKKLVVKFADNEASDTIVEATLDGEGMARVCYECGGEFFTDANGVNYHGVEGEIDYEADANHTAYMMKI